MILSEVRTIEDDKDKQKYAECTQNRISFNQLESLEREEAAGTLTPYGRDILDGFHSDIQLAIQETAEELKNAAEAAMRNPVVSISDVQTALSYFTDHYGKFFEKYKIYCLFIERKLWQHKYIKINNGYNIYDALEIAKAYTEAYKIKSAPDQISEEEQAQIDKFLQYYFSDEHKAEATPKAEPIPSLLELNGFMRLLQGTGTNSLAQMSSRRIAPQIDAFTGQATISYNKVTAYIENYNNLPSLLNLNALILLDFCNLYLSQLNDYGSSTGLKTTVSIPLDDYMIRCGIPITKESKDKARREVKAALETLYNLSIEFDETKTTKDKKKPEHYHVRILQERSDIKNGIIYARFGQRFVEYLNKCGLMEYPAVLLSIDRRNPTTYHMGRKLCYHNSMDNNRKRGTANNISVKALLDCCPDIPSYEEINNDDRHIGRRIIDPFEAALDSLMSKYHILDSWEYCNKLKAPLTKEQANDLDYDTFIKLQIKFVIANAPDPKERLAAKAEETKKRSASKRATVKKTYKNKAESKGEG